MAESEKNKTEMFLLTYVFQTSIHSIWRERNGKKHGDVHQSSASLLKYIDKGVRNRISTLCMGKSRGEAMKKN